MQRLGTPVKLAVAFTISLLLTQFTIGILSTHNPAVYSTLNEYILSFTYLFLFCFRVGLLVTLIYILALWLSQKAAFWVSTILLAIVLLTHLSLVSYLIQTGILLGADLWGYSFSEITHTVSSSGGISFKGVIVWMAGLTSFIGFSYFILRLTLGKYLTYTFLGLFIISWFIPGPSSYQFDTEQAFAYVKNPTTHFVEESFGQLFTGTNENNFEIPEYPFLRPFEEPNVLGKYLPEKGPPPDIVIIAVEGLGADFLADGTYHGFTPFLDSLRNHSLYWENCLSNSGRTFGVLPSILGSLPYGNSGFMNLGVNMPDHHTLFSILKQNGYHTSFFYGGNANFDQQDLFLERQSLDYIMDQSKFPISYHKMDPNKEGFSWGFGDREVFDYSLKKIKEFPEQPKAAFYLTLTTHEPFVVPDKTFKSKGEEILNSRNINLEKKEIYENYREVFECLLYTDNSIRELFFEYRNFPSYNKTIFIITGDHRLIPVPAENRLKRFHVPLLIYSPGLIKTNKPGSLVAHSQITPSLLAYLKGSCNLMVPSHSSFISGSLTDTPSFTSSLDIPLMRNKNETKEYVYTTKLLTGDKLFDITPELLLQPLQDDNLTEELKNKMSLFKAKSEIALSENKLLPDSLSTGKTHRYFELTEKEKQFMEKEHLLQLPPDSIYFKARAFAMARSFFESRALIKRGLNNSPNYHDLRILLSRTYSWDGDYKTAKLHLDEVFKRAGHYEDAYIALSDLQYWEKDLNSSLLTAIEGLDHFPESIELLIRLGRAQLALGNDQEGKKSLNRALELNPDHTMANRLLQRNLN